MKKLPLVFCLLIAACSSQKQVVFSDADFSNHHQPYYIFAVGKWNTDYLVLTLKDADNSYFTVKSNVRSLIKIGDIYKP